MRKTPDTTGDRKKRGGRIAGFWHLGRTLTKRGLGEDAALGSIARGLLDGTGSMSDAEVVASLRAARNGIDRGIQDRILRRTPPRDSQSEPPQGRGQIIPFPGKRTREPN